MTSVILAAFLSLWGQSGLQGPLLHTHCQFLLQMWTLPDAFLSRTIWPQPTGGFERRSDSLQGCDGNHMLSDTHFTDAHTLRAGINGIKNCFKPLMFCWKILSCRPQLHQNAELVGFLDIFDLFLAFSWE